MTYGKKNLVLQVRECTQHSQVHGKSTDQERPLQVATMARQEVHVHVYLAGHYDDINEQIMTDA